MSNDWRNEVSRRDFVVDVSRVAAGIVVAKSLPSVIASQEPPITTSSAPFSRAFNFAALKDWITPNDDFFVRRHFGVTRVETAVLKVTITGADSQTRTLAINEIKELPAVERVITMERAGNW